jgi:hypothetical protein
VWQLAVWRASQGGSPAATSQRCHARHQAAAADARTHAVHNVRHTRQPHDAALSASRRAIAVAPGAFSTPGACHSACAEGRAGLCSASCCMHGPLRYAALAAAASQGLLLARERGNGGTCCQPMQLLVVVSATSLPLRHCHHTHAAHRVAVGPGANVRCCQAGDGQGTTRRRQGGDENRVLHHGGPLCGAHVGRSGRHTEALRGPKHSRCCGSAAGA